MSVAYSFVCDECKQKVWAGQSAYIYKYDYIARFLHEHLGHNIRFLGEDSDDERSEDYEDVEDKLTDVV